jgi:hypothetical protein
MKRMNSTKPHPGRKRGYALVVAASLVLAACGGGSGSREGTSQPDQPIDTPDDPAPPPANRAPVPVISNPVEGKTFRAGDSIGFEGSATDPEDGTLPAKRLSWWVDLGPWRLHHGIRDRGRRLLSTGWTLPTAVSRPVFLRGPCGPGHLAPGHDQPHAPSAACCKI